MELILSSSGSESESGYHDCAHYAGPTSGLPARMHMPPRRRGRLKSEFFERGATVGTQTNKRNDENDTLTVFVPGRRHCPNTNERLRFRGRAAVSVKYGRSQGRRVQATSKAPSSGLLSSEA